MVTTATNPFCESMGQRVTCMGALHPTPKVICSFQFEIREHSKGLHLRLTPEYRVLISSFSVFDADKLLKSNGNITEMQTVTI